MDKGGEMKTYLGDSVYVDFDGYHLVLTTENGGGASNTIYLEPTVYTALTRYVERTYNETYLDGGKDEARERA